MLQIKRWLPTRELVVVTDSSFAALELLAAVSKRKQQPIQMITRLRLDAALYEPAPPRLPITMGRPRLKGKRLPNLEKVLVNPNAQWEQITLNRWYGEGKRQVEICTLYGCLVSHRFTCSTDSLGIGARPPR